MARRLLRAVHRTAIGGKYWRFSIAITLHEISDCGSSKSAATGNLSRGTCQDRYQAAVSNTLGSKVEDYSEQCHPRRATFRAPDRVM